jgi:threonine/homoserine/homoserine lactone efflux protein
VNTNYRNLGAIAFIAGVALSIMGFVLLATKSLTPFEALIVIGAFYLAWQWLKLNRKSLIGACWPVLGIVRK